MNSNFLCKVYGVRGYRVTGQCHKDNKTILKIERKLEKPRDFDPFGQAGLSPLATI